jgi:hypothetical protein
MDVSHFPQVIVNLARHKNLGATGGTELGHNVPSEKAGSTRNDDTF